MTVGLIDSGIGGLHILNALYEQYPKENYIYISDNQFAPYGSLNADMLTDRLTYIARFLEAKGADTVVLACNTASLAAGKKLQEKLHIPIVLTMPDFDRCKECEDGKILVLSTTLSASILQKTDSVRKIKIVGLSGLAQEVERVMPNGDVSFDNLIRLLSPYHDAKVCFLSCTHYIYIQELISKLLPNAVFYDGIDKTVEDFAKLHSPVGRASKPFVRVLFSGQDERDKYDRVLKVCFPLIKGVVLFENL